MLLYEDHEGIVTSVAFSPDGSFLASSGRDGSVIIRDSSGNARPLWPQGPKPVSIVGLSFLPSGDLIIGHEAGWEILRQQGEAWPLLDRTEQFGVTALAPLSAQLLAVGTGEKLSPTSGLLQLHDLKLHRAVPPSFREAQGVRSIATCPSQKLVAWTTSGRDMKVWDIRKQTPVAIRNAHPCQSLALAADGSMVAAVQDWAVRIYDLAAKMDLIPLKGHKGLVSCVAFSPDSATVATGSWDGTVRFWDARTGMEKAVFQWPIGKVFSLAFTPDGSRAAAGGEAGGVVVWDVE